MPRPLLLLTAALVAAVAAPATAEPVFSGQPSSIHDGDSMVVEGQRIRLWGIDAPETDQTCWDAAGAPYACGIVSRDALRSKVGSSSVDCAQKDVDRFGRVVAQCSLPQPDGSALDLNDWMVRQGLAMAYRRFTDAYVAAEDEARVAQRGIWAGTFQPPWDFRSAPSPPPAPPGSGSLVTEAPAAAPGPAPTVAPGPVPEAQWSPEAPCLIKGNINSMGEKIYHVPGSPSYQQTVIDEAAGERWFCSEEEAVAAGWRPPAGS